MNKFMLSDEAYAEFKNFLAENNISDFSIRVNLAGYGCSGPAFNITIEEPKETDTVEVIKDITFFADNSLIEEFGGFMILSTEENNGMGLSLKPVIAPESSGCSTCSGCH
ncbi:MAG: HesB-like protein [Clostridiaceae bacterium]